MCLRDRVGRKERQAKAGLVAALHPTLGRIIQVMGHRWKHTFTATSTDRQTGGQTSSPKGWSAAQWGHRLAAACLPVGGSCLGSHNLARPCLVGGMGSQLGEHHLHSLKLLVLGWDGTHLVGHLISFYRHVLSLDAGGQKGKGQLDIPGWLPALLDQSPSSSSTQL